MAFPIVVWPRGFNGGQTWDKVILRTVSLLKASWYLVFVAADVLWQLPFRLPGKSLLPNSSIANIFIHVKSHFLYFLLHQQRWATDPLHGSAGRELLNLPWSSCSLSKFCPSLTIFHKAYWCHYFFMQTSGRDEDIWLVRLTVWMLISCFNNNNIPTVLNMSNPLHILYCVIYCYFHLIGSIILILHLAARLGLCWAHMSPSAYKCLCHRYGWKMPYQGLLIPMMGLKYRAVK